VSSVIREIPFGDLLAVPLRNGVYKPKTFHGRGTKVVNMKELFAHDRIDDQAEQRVSLTEEEIARYSLEPGDLLFARRSFVLEGAGKCTLIGTPREPTVFESSMIRARIDPSAADPAYLYYFFRSPLGRSCISSIATRTAVSGITGRNLAGLRLPLPPVAFQQVIASRLGDLDDLMESSRRRVEVLEQMAQVIYREWFVRFRFPGHEDATFVDSPLGRIPEGWEIAGIDRIVEAINFTVDPATIDPTTPAVGLEHIPRRQLTLDDWGEARDLGSRKATFKRSDVLFGKIRPYFHKVSVAPLDGICSTDAIVIRPANDYWGLGVMTVFSDEFVANAVQTSNGTKMPRADWKVLRTFPVAVPPSDLARHFNALCRETLECAAHLMMGNRRLAAVRDLLLPKLVTGQIDVSDLDLDAVAVV
jgi:type I restriction enzyme S subunit